MYSVTEHVVNFISTHQLTWDAFKEHYFLWTIGILLALKFLSSIVKLWIAALIFSMVFGGIASGIVGIFVALFDERKLSFWTRYIQNLEPTFYHVNDILWILSIIFFIFYYVKFEKNKKR